MASARLEWTSVPRWTSPELPAAASYLACWFGDRARPAVQALLAGAGPGVPVRTAGFGRRWDGVVEAEVRRLIGECRVGVRIILAGSEATVMRSAAVARELGASAEELILVAIDAAADAADAAGVSGVSQTEITARSAERPGATTQPATATETATVAVHQGYVHGVAGRRVFCAPCRRAFDAIAAIGETTVCPGCAAQLIVDYRFSRPHAAYFGWPTGLDLHR